MRKNNIIVIKLGGSIITDKSIPYTPDIPVLRRLAREISKSHARVLIVHGQGSFAHTSAKKYGGKKGYKSLIGVAEVFKDAMAINSIVVDELFKAGLPAVSFRPNSLFLAESGKPKKNNLQPVKEALDQGLVPVLFGDVIMDTTWKTTIFSGEIVESHLIPFLLKKEVHISKIVQVGITNGVLDSYGGVIDEINKDNFAFYKSSIFGSGSTDVTGGMMHKVKTGLKIAKRGIPTYIINGSVKNNLYKALAGEAVGGTTIK